MTPLEVLKMLKAGVDQPEIVRRLVETGSWSMDGASDIVSFMTEGPDAQVDNVDSPGTANVSRARTAR